MRLLGRMLAGVLALTAPIAAPAGPLGSKLKLADAVPAPGIVQVWDGNRPGWHPVPSGRADGWNQIPGHSRQWNGGWVPRRWGPSGLHGAWGPNGVAGVPTYWVWGPSGGAFDYPFADWRGPTGSWGNP
jgi:hypothetical protein